MELRLKIYKAENHNEVEKVYSVDSLTIMFGTVEDIINVIDIDKINDNTAVAGMILKGWKQLKPFLIDIFPGLTEEEIKRVKITEMIPLFGDIFKSIADDLNILVSGKN